MKPKYLFILIIALLAISSESKAQLDSTSKKNAEAVCKCIDKAGLSKMTNPEDLQKGFLKCMIDSMSESFGDILAGSSGDMSRAGEDFGKKIAFDLMAIGCQPFIEIAMKLAQTDTNGDTETTNESKLKSITGTVVSFEEKDFTHLTVKPATGANHSFIYLDYVPGSDAWVKNPLSLKGKKVKIQWEEKELYQPKLKQFVTYKIIRKVDKL